MARVAEATTSDLTALAAFFWDAWEQAGPDAPGWAGAEREVMEEITGHDVLAARVGGPERRMFLAWEEDAVVGFSATRREGVSAELVGIVVREDRTGAGIGGPLLEAAAAAMRDEGVRSLTVRTEAGNRRALGFYRRHGFTEVGEAVEDVEGTRVVLCELVRDLEAAPAGG